MMPAQGVSGTERKIEYEVSAQSPEHAFAKMMGDWRYNIHYLASFGDEVFSCGHELLIWTERDASCPKK